MGAAYWDGEVAGIFYRTNRGNNNSITIIGFRALVMINASLLQVVHYHLILNMGPVEDIMVN